MTSRRSFLRLLGLSPIAAPVAVAAMKADMGAAVGRMSVGTSSLSIDLVGADLTMATADRISRKLGDLGAPLGEIEALALEDVRLTSTVRLTDAGLAAVRARDVTGIGFSDFSAPAGGEALPANDLDEPTFLDLYTDEAA